ALYVLDKLGVKPENAYLVGDGETDVLAAINAGITGIAALWGNRTKEQLKAAGGTIFADTPKDILKIII
ncbi:MAG: HAD hydrolase-like protein, partial [Clostridia bacterium]|nr:HAD hydrolase-like protein [Clostridia bacterium]